MAAANIASSSSGGGMPARVLPAWPARSGTSTSILISVGVMPSSVDPAGHDAVVDVVVALAPGADDAGVVVSGVLMARPAEAVGCDAAVVGVAGDDAGATFPDGAFGAT